MTVDTAIAEAAEDAADFSPASDHDAAAYFKTALLFMTLAVVVGIAVMIQAVTPGFLGGIEVLSYGRLQPAFTNLFISGWLTIGLVGALLFVVPRATRVEPQRSGPVSRAAVALLAVGVLAGTVAILFGFSEGRRYLEAPLWADAIVLVGLLAAARPVIGVVRSGDRDDLGMIQWYAGGAFTWLILAHIVGNIPGLSGTSAHLQILFYRASLIGLWLAAAGVAVVGYLAPRLTGRAASSGSRLSVLGFWSMAFVWAMTAPAEATFGPLGDWLETIGIVFAIGMVVPVLVIFADLVTSVRGRLGEVTERTTLRLVFGGAIGFALIPVFTLAGSFRSSSSVVGFTEWVTATELLVFGTFTMWLMAIIRFAASAADGRSARLYQLGTTVGLVLAIGAAAFAGVQTGFTWAGSANSRVFANTGDGFVNSLQVIEGPRVLMLVGFAIFGLTQMLAAAGLVGSGLVRPEPALEAADIPDPDLAPVRPLGLNKLRFGAVGLFVVALTLVGLLPSLESEQRDPTLLADFSRNYADGGSAAEGRQVYIREGCQACHTQVVRANVTDVGLGAVSLAGDSVREVPALFGWQRIGPDLTHIGARTAEEFIADNLAAFNVASLDDLDPEVRATVLQSAKRDARDALRAHLADPQAARSWSTMPSYDHLKSADLDRLADYLMTLE